MNRILITGATGFLGAAVAARYLAEGAGRDLLFLARGSSAGEGLNRILSQLRRFEVPEATLSRLSADQIIAADLCDFEKRQDDARFHDITHVINCAALASFGNDPRVWEINVNATLAFARQARHWPRLQRFLQIGTAMSCGMQAPSPVMEDYEPGEGAEHAVPYTASKAAAEAGMRAEIPDLPLVVARPSIVVGHTRLGCKPSASIYWVFRVGKGLGGFACSHTDQIDVIPVDYCADVLFGLAQRNSLKFDRYHISAGTGASCTFGEIDRTMSQELGIAPAGDFQLLDFKTLAAMHPRFEELFGPCNKFLMLRAIELYGRFAALNMIFDHRRLMAEGLPQPPRFTDYLGLCAHTAKDGLIAEQMRVDLKWDRFPRATKDSSRQRVS